MSFDLQRLQNENKALRRAMWEMRNSLTWRLTAPLRAVLRPWAPFIRTILRIPARAPAVEQPARVAGSADLPPIPVRTTTEQAGASAVPPNSYVPYFSFAQTQSKDGIKAIAFYLPQFHPIPENDLWWGKGFTEWNSVIRGRPRFAGHYQPRLPGELGFYDLRVPEVMQRQVELARNYGIFAFCFYYYWFSGKRILDRPLDRFLHDSGLDIEFCLCWANENWTRRWDGLDQEILIHQDYSDEDRESFVVDVLPYFHDKRYLRIDDKPVFLIYRLHDIPDPAAWIKRLRESAVANGLPGLYLIAALTNEFPNSLAPLCDACVEFPPHRLEIDSIAFDYQISDPQFTGHIYSYPDLVNSQIAAHKEFPVPLYRSVFPGWDNEARRPGRGHTFADTSPEVYRQWLTHVCGAAEKDHPADRRLVFINAWNEWSEGAYLEPDAGFGYAYLQATRECLVRDKLPAPADVQRKQLANPARLRSVIFLHLFYEDLWEEIASRLAHMPPETTLVVTYCQPNDYLVVDRIRQRFPDAITMKVPNRGRDVLPFFIALTQALKGRYDLVCKIHTKRSPHRVDGDFWRQDLLDKLIGSPGHFQAVSDAFRADPTLGMLIPQDHYIDGRMYWGSNERRVLELASRLGMPASRFDKFRFCAGSMFWARGDVLADLLKLDLGIFDFEPEQGQLDATLAHAIERLLAEYFVYRGYRIEQIDKGAQLFRDYGPEPYRFVNSINTAQSG